MQEASSKPPGSPRYRAVELDRHLGQRFRFLRLLSGCSQRQVADRLGLTFQQVQKYENGTNRISASLLAEVAGLFGVSMDWFAGPFGAVAEAGQGASARQNDAILDTLFRGFHDKRDAEAAAALRLLCTLAQATSPADDPLGRLRQALRTCPPDEAAFLLEAARRIAEPGGAALPATDIDRPGPKTGTVLLVDDDPDVLAMLSAAVGSAGLDVTALASGDAALAVLASAAPVDVLVTDYAMVGMDGVELLAQARQLRPGLPGIVVTGFADAGRLHDLPPGIEVLAKPFRRMELIGRVRLLLDKAPPVRGQSVVSPAA